LFRTHVVFYVGPAAIADYGGNIVGKCPLQRHNDIGAQQAHALANVLKEHATLKSLCGNKGNETELDMSGKKIGGKKIGADGAIMLAPEIADNGALVKLDISSNYIGGEQEENLQAAHLHGQRHRARYVSSTRDASTSAIIATTSAIAETAAKAKTAAKSR
jgi:hypothetical protein